MVEYLIGFFATKGKVTIATKITKHEIKMIKLNFEAFITCLCMVQISMQLL